MGARIPLREDFDEDVLRRLAKRSKDGAQTRRLLALAEIYGGARRTKAAMIGGVTLQIVRDWVIRFNTEGPDGLINRKAAGPKRKLTDNQRRALAEIVEQGPTPSIHGVVRWRRSDLAQWLWDEFGVLIEESTVGRELKALGFAKLSVRPRHHAQSERAADDFKKALQAQWRKSRNRSATV